MYSIFMRILRIQSPHHIISKIPILRPPLGLSKSGLKTTFGQSQRWSLIRGTLGVENKEKNKSNFANEVFNRHNVLILGGLNSGISLYMLFRSCFHCMYFI